MTSLLHMKPTPLYALINKSQMKWPYILLSSLFDHLTLDSSLYLAAMFLDVSQFGLLLVVAIFFNKYFANDLVRLQYNFF